MVKIFEKFFYQNFRNIQKFFVWKYEGSISNRLGAINEKPQGGGVEVHPPAWLGLKLEINHLTEVYQKSN